MAKKYFQKALAVGLSLTLCAGLVAPSFAANFTQLQHALNNGTAADGLEISEENGTRKVTLTDNVVRDGNEQAIVVKQNDDGTENKVILDLNGKNIDGTEGTGAVISVGLKGAANVDLTIRDSTAHTETDADGNETYVAGSITGGHDFINYWNGEYGLNKGQGLIVWGSATLESGKITGNSTADKGSGAGVLVSGSFTMKGGEISGNTSEGYGGGVDVNGAGHSFIMNGGVIRDNTAALDGDGVYVRKGSGFTMTGGTIIGNMTVADDKDTDTGTGTKVAITGGTFSQLNDKYLDDGHGLWLKGNTYEMVEHGDGKHTFVNGVCQVVGCDAQAPVTETPAATTTYAPAEAEVEIDEPAVPLAAGPVTCGEFIDYLWRHEGEPESEPATFTDVPADHEYAPAIGWAQSIGIISGDIFDPDELVTVGAVWDILVNFAAYSDMVMPELTTLTGDEDEAVLNCDEVLAEFFGEDQAE